MSCSSFLWAHLVIRQGMISLRTEVHAHVSFSGSLCVPLNMTVSEAGTILFMVSWDKQGRLKAFNVGWRLRKLN